MFNFDWRMSQTCAHTLLTLELDEAPPPHRAPHTAQGGQAGLEEEAQLLKDSSEHSVGAWGPQYTILDPSPTQGGGVRGPSPADSKSLSPLHSLGRGPRTGSFPLFLLIQPAVPDGSPCVCTQVP